MELLVIEKQEYEGFVINFFLSGVVDFKMFKCFVREVESDLFVIDGIFKVELKGFLEEEIEISFQEEDF